MAKVIVRTKKIRRPIRLEAWPDSLSCPIQRVFVCINDACCIRLARFRDVMQKMPVKTILCAQESDPLPVRQSTSGVLFFLPSPLVGEG